MLLTYKPLSNFVEATITRETGGVCPFRHKTVPRKGLSYRTDPACGLLLSSQSLKGMGPQKDELWYCLPDTSAEFV